MLLVDQVHKSFGTLRAVRGVSFEIPRGQVVGLLGPNGAGKTTTIRMITGFTPPDAGRVLIDGDDITQAAAKARGKIGYLPESAPLYGEMTVRDYLSFRSKLYGLERGARRSAIDRAMDRCWLREVAGRRIGQLSKGFKQRVGLAGALLHGPDVLVLDEPTNGLDPTQVSETRTLIRELGVERTLLISSHVLTEIERLCDRVIVLAGGTLRADGSPRSLIDAAGFVARYTVEIEVPRTGGTASIVMALGRVAGVASVQIHEEPGIPEASGRSWGVFTVSPEAGFMDLRETIAESARASGLLVRSLERERPSLERVFMELVERDGLGETRAVARRSA